MTRDLAKKIVISQYSPDVIVGILRGGCVPAVHLSHLLNTRPFLAVHLQTTVSNEVRAERQVPLATTHPNFVDLMGKKVLLVDDVTNTGDTLSVAKTLITEYCPAALRSAVLVWDTVPPSGTSKVPKIGADFWSAIVHAWVIFPWNE